MSIVYILEEINNDGAYEIVGAVSNEQVAHKFYVLDSMIRRWSMKYIDDPDLLNRIAKESESNK